MIAIAFDTNHDHSLDADTYTCLIRIMIMITHSILIRMHGRSAIRIIINPPPPITIRKGIGRPARKSHNFSDIHSCFELRNAGKLKLETGLQWIVYSAARN